MDEFREFRYSLDEVGIDQVSDPLGWFFADFGGQLDFKDTVWEQLLFFGIDSFEWMIDSDIHTSPITVCSIVPVEIVFTDHGEFRIE